MMEFHSLNHRLSAVKWMNEVLKKSLGEIDSNFKRFRISEALMNSYKLFWDEFSGWYLEIIKPEYEKPVDRLTYNATISCFRQSSQDNSSIHAIHNRGDMADDLRAERWRKPYDLTDAKDQEI